MKTFSKRIRSGKEKLDQEKKYYTLEEAIMQLKAFPRAKFDETVELNFNLGIDLKKSEQMVRGTVSLPHGTGKKVRVIVFCRGEEARDAESAGADHVGAEELIEKVAGGWLDFDVVVAHPEMMKEISKLGRVLGPRGLMPSPKVGTVTKDLGRAVKDIQKGKIDFKSDKTGGIHVPIGKVSFTAEQIKENAEAVIKMVRDAKPQSSKGTYVKSVAICSTMGAGFRLDVASLGIAN
ncbi:MAG: 50S ribosomal protein L1 [Candidatus Omnitrophica bacterium]|nr:50S ribosomal protein L1 [Candidatus Omnitrophota bacterium]